MKTFPKKHPLRLTPVTMHELVMQDDFSPAIISHLNEYQKAKVRRFLRARLVHCQPRERKLLSSRLAMLAPDADAKLDTWEHHHANVCTAIAGYLQENAAMPTQAVLAAKTGYSRQTINKHLKAYRAHPSYIEQAETMRLMKMKVTEKMLSMALLGDIRAAKVFIETVSRAERRTQPYLNQQNNFFRINGLFITEEKLNGLLPDQRAQLEALLDLNEELDSSLGRNDKSGALSLNTVDQNDSDTQISKGLPFGTSVNPDMTPNPLNESK